MIFGAAVFAEPTFADIYRKAAPDDGWHDAWKDPCDEEHWVKQDASCAEPIKIDKPQSNWTVIK